MLAAVGYPAPGQPRGDVQVVREGGWSRPARGFSATTAPARPLQTADAWTVSGPGVRPALRARRHSWVGCALGQPVLSWRSCSTAPAAACFSGWPCRWPGCRPGVGPVERAWPFLQPFFWPRPGGPRRVVVVGRRRRLPRLGQRGGQLGAGSGSWSTASLASSVTSSVALRPRPAGRWRPGARLLAGLDVGHRVDHCGAAVAAVGQQLVQLATACCSAGSADGDGEPSVAGAVAATGLLSSLFCRHRRRRRSSRPRRCRGRRCRRRRRR